MVLLFLRQKKTGVLLSVPAWLAATAGLFYVGGAAVTMLQLLHAASLTGYVPKIFVTLIVILVPVILGIFLLKISLSLSDRGSIPSRAVLELLLLGLLGLLSWSGFIVGPLLAMASGVLVWSNRN
jgi:hypothetical protein